MRHSLPSHIDPKHPLVRQEYAVYTPPIHRMATTIGDWIDQRKPGGYIHGPSRFGKSKGIKWHIANVLEERFQACIPLVTWSRPPDVEKSETEFWRELLKASKFQFTARPPTRAMGRHLFTERLVTIARAARTNFVVLLIDEAQDISLREWKWLVGLQNQMDWEGYRLSVFSIGSHQIGYQHEFMARTGNAHVAARFLVTHTAFHGLRSIQELAYVLEGYDTASEWPKKSKKSFLNYFAPEIYASGKRVAQCADIVWQVLIELSPVKQREFPMQHIAQAVEGILFRLANGEEWESVTSYSSWLEAIAQTEFSDHMKMISTSS